ncbi:nuclear transport factor 2 family protein [uncultured Pontibacter sp.]|uniref:nuclear transport factor 2 family protein n=1 Tax=uncultured Pontibacter sp. TaxID=453356 RepID=UPI00262B8F6A|nr:nuclear transport factor 2 family protein [uncultured Pontibacter sp.]
MKNMDQQNVIRSYIDAYNKFDVEGMLQHLHEQVEFENISDGKVNTTTKGKAAFGEQARQAIQYFKQRQQSISSISEKANKIEATINYNAILAVNLPNGLKAGETLTLSGKSIFTFKDGKIFTIQDIS